MVKRLRIALIGCGFIGETIVDSINKGLVGDVELVAVYDVYTQKAETLAKKVKEKLRVAKDPSEIFVDREIDLVIEAASQEAVKKYIPSALRAGKNVMIMSVGALADFNLFNEIKSIAKKKNARVFIPSGAICGLDGVKSASIAGLDKVIITTTMPTWVFEGNPYVTEKNIDLGSFRAPKTIFEGNASEAVRYFPKNVNVAATLSLAGIGLEKTRVRIIADPNVNSSIQEICAEGQFGKLQTKVENVLGAPRLHVLSAVKKLKQIGDSISLGT